MTTPPTQVDPTDAERALAEALLGMEAVHAVFLGGSRATRFADATSDTDLYALVDDRLPGSAERHAVLAGLADGGEVTQQTAWGVEDHLRIHDRRVEIIYWPLAGIVDDFYDPGVAPTGYTTAVLHTLAAGVPLGDRSGELARLRDRLRTFPEATRDRVLAQLPTELASYLRQLRKAQQRGDWTNVVNRRAAFADAWFDLVFALNRVFHPGEKRLLSYLGRLPIQPDAAVERWSRAALLPADSPDLPELLAALAADLQELLDA